MNASQHKFWRGVVLYSICEHLEIPKQDYEKASKRIHNALKEFFEVKSFSDLSVSEFEKVSSIVQMIWAREYGWIIPQADESNFNANQATLHELLKFKKIIL